MRQHQRAHQVSPRGVNQRAGVQREKIYIYGKHALTEALANAPHVVRKVFLAHEMHDSGP